MDSFWEFFWFMLTTFFLVAYLMILFQIIRDLFRDHSVSGGMKAVWVVGLIFLPLLTAVVYLIARGPGMAQRQVADVTAAQESAEAYIRSVAGGGSSPSDEIARAKALQDAGTISTEEYERLKAKALG